MHKIKNKYVNNSIFCKLSMYKKKTSIIKISVNCIYEKFLVNSIKFSIF